MLEEYTQIEILIRDRFLFSAHTRYLYLGMKPEIKVSFNCCLLISLADYETFGPWPFNTISSTSKLRRVY